MSQSVRYQVFLSSTFTDLKEERAEVLQAIWELDCIPTGMEAFLATNESQWEVIEKVIDECDYYVLLIGGRYGSTTVDGISYTEKEYNYAKSLGLPVLAFVHGDPGNIVAAKVEKAEAGRDSLERFRARVMAEHPIRTWTNAQELGGVVSRSLSRAIKVSPRPGWVRNTGSSNLELLEQINALTKENALLKTDSRKIDKSKIENLSGGSDTTTIDGIVNAAEKEKVNSVYQSVRWKTIVSWDDVFRDVGPILMNESSEDRIKNELARFVGWSKDVVTDKYWLKDSRISPESFATVMVQLRALGLVRRGTRKRAVSDRDGYWGITESGEEYLINLLAKKKRSPIVPLPSVIDNKDAGTQDA